MLPLFRLVTVIFHASIFTDAALSLSLSTEECAKEKERERERISNRVERESVGSEKYRSNSVKFDMEVVERLQFLVSTNVRIASPSLLPSVGNNEAGGTISRTIYRIYIPTLFEFALVPRNNRQ